MKRIYILFLLLFISYLILPAKSFPDPMQPARMVNDFVGVFTDAQRYDLEKTLRAYNDSTSTQIYIVTVATLDGYTSGDYATRLGREWGIGQEEKDNGILILIKPNYGASRGEVYIATGYGVEHILTDGRVGFIISKYMMSDLQDGNYYSACNNAAKVIIQYLSGEFKADEKSNTNYLVGLGFLVVFAAFMIFSIYMIVSGKGRNGGESSSGSSSDDSDSSFSGGGGGSFGGGGAGSSF